MPLLAKSAKNGSVTLADHTCHVLEAVVKMAGAWGFDETLARNGAILHDLGKAHPYFQSQVNDDETPTQGKPIHRHEFSSLLFLPVFPKDDWDKLIDLVVAHHKPIRDEVRERGILDLDERWGQNFYNNHLGDWETWSLPVFEMLRNDFGIICEPFPKEQALAALEYAVEYCWQRPLGWSPLRGLLMAGDHFASAFNYDVNQQLDRILKNPDLTWFHSRQSALYPLSLEPTDDPRPHTLVVAPTGAGKTDFLLRRCSRRVFYTLPYQASINAMFKRLQAAIPDADIRLQHATSKIVVSGKMDEQILQNLTGSAAKVLTPHQLAGIIFGTPGFESTMLDLRDCDVILDEIHTYGDLSMAMVLEIVQALLRLHCRLHVGTATMPTILYDRILSLLGGEAAVYEVHLPEQVLDTYNRHLIYKEAADFPMNETLKAAFAEGEKVLVVFNTIKGAQEAFRNWQEQFPDVPSMLLHSRFRRKDRVDLEQKLQSEYNDQKKFRPCLVVSTQVVEVSLDISFDRMITEAAPIDALIQRFGRINRIRKENPAPRPIHVIAPSGNTLPYKKAIVEASFDQLPNGGILEEKTLQQRIDAVYTSIDTKEIDAHLIYWEGQYRIKELTHRPKSLLLDALEIESATCILETDRDNYLEAKYEERIGLEIPIGWRTIAKYSNEFEQLKEGSYPFVVPRNGDYDSVGLVLKERDPFL